MPCFLVIDSLARSGTTLLAALINSQHRCASLRGAFHEPLACGLGSWPYGLANLPITPRDLEILVHDRPIDLAQEESMQRVWTDAPSAAGHGISQLSFDGAYFRKSSLDIIRRLQQTQLFSLVEWQQFLNFPLQSVADIDQIYTGIVQNAGLDLIGFRWNQGLFYVNQWIRRPNHFWCVIIRNPLDRAASAFKTHNWPFELSLEASIAFAENIYAVHQDQRVHVMYYEDLVADPTETLSQLFSWLQLPQDNINLKHLINQDGRRYRSETAEDVDRYGTHKHGRSYDSIYGFAIGRHKGIIPENIASEYRRRLRDLPVYERYFPDF